MTLVMIFFILMAVISNDINRSDYSYYGTSYDSFKVTAKRNRFLRKLVRTVLRNIYMLRHKDFSKNVHNQYRLYNKNILIIYEKVSTTIKCYELDNNLRKLFFQRFYNPSIITTLDVFDRLMHSFNYDINFNDIVNYLNSIKVCYVIKDETNTNKDKLKKPVLKFNSKKVDVNSASEKELANLPGINIVNAKKIIQKRDLKGGFKTKEEFMQLLKLKEHFLKQIEELIEINDYFSNSNSDANTNERIIDL